MNQNAMSIWTFSFWMRVTRGARQSSNEPAQRRAEALAGVKTNTRKASENDEIQNAFLFLLVINSLGYSSIDTSFRIAVARRVPHTLTSPACSRLPLKMFVASDPCAVSADPSGPNDCAKVEV